MNIVGISAGFHDAAVCLLDSNGCIEFAGHSERYSKKKNDSDISLALLNEIDMSQVGTIAYYERPWIKQLRQWYAGQGVEWDRITARQVLEQQIGANRVGRRPIKTYNHHLCHAAAGFQTSPFDRATVVVIDAIGEWDTVSIWAAEYSSTGRAKYRRLWGQHYPHSIGLFYSAITKRVGLHPLDEEYITMGMAAYGNSAHIDRMRELLIQNHHKIQFKNNLHTGLDDSFMADVSEMDIAASAQKLTEQLIGTVMQQARSFNFSSNLVYMGGVALNCLANRKLGEYFDRTWIMPCPGDAGSSVGAAALAYGYRINWDSAYLGHDIKGEYPVADLVQELVVKKIAGVASGRAEFGPRALGNRSLLADPRGPEIKDQVNSIKRRQKFRPFAPVILEEMAHNYFEFPCGWKHSRYMQVIARCRHPDLFPAIVHADGTSRVQTVPNDNSGIRKLLEAWYAKTRTPLLLNTSLNIRGEPMVNDRADADRFESLYGVKVFS